MVSHTCSPIALEAETGRLQVQTYPGLHHEICLRKKSKIMKTTPIFCKSSESCYCSRKRIARNAWIIPALGRQRQKNQEFKDILGHTQSIPGYLPGRVEKGRKAGRVLRFLLPFVPCPLTLLWPLVPRHSLLLSQGRASLPVCPASGTRELTC